MDSKAIRVFYRKSDNQIVWYHEITAPEGTEPIFPTTLDADLAKIPTNKPDGETPLGGQPDDYACIKLLDTATIDAYFASDTNQVVNSQLLIGPPRPPPEPDPDTIRAQEILTTSPDAITMPEMWELLRIYGRRLGYQSE